MNTSTNVLHSSNHITIIKNYPQSPAHLRHVSDREDGFGRVKKKDKFVFIDENGKTIRDKLLNKRLQALVIPPAWENVWICKDENGHLLCTGRDEKGRKQAIYHPDWTAYRNQTKFFKLIEFGFCLASLRSKINSDLRKREWTKQKVTALAIALMQTGLLRVGNDKYLKNNQTYGLTTLRRKHLKQLSTKELQISYKAKSNKQRNISITNPSLIKKLKQCAALSGQELFRYKGDDKKWHRIQSCDINEYLEQVTKHHFTAKTFRTWGASVATLEFCNEAKEEVRQNKRKKLDTLLVKKVAQKLGNTVSVCRQYYIHPTALEMALAYEQEKLQRVTENFLQQLSKESQDFTNQLDLYTFHELQLLALLNHSLEKEKE